MTGIHDSLIVIDGLVIAKWSRAVFADMRKGGLTGANCTCSIWDLRLEQVRNRLRAGGRRIRTIGPAKAAIAALAA
jgi:membrane dipeptidase